MSLIEIVVVVGLMAFVYTVAIPQFSLRTGTEAINKVNRIASDIRNAYDLAVLSNKPYRLVFKLSTGEYWLEEADREFFYLGDEKMNHDLTEDEEKEQQLEFEQSFEEYVDLAGLPVKDPENDTEIKPTSPVVEAKDQLRKPKWTPVENMEWGRRTIGPYLMIQDMQAEHHGQKQSAMDLGPEGRGMIYIFPKGYVERAVLHIVYTADEGVPDESQPGYTVITNPYEGTADVTSGYEEVDVHQDLSQS